MPNWYVGREPLKRALGLNGADVDPIIDQYIEAASRTIDRELGRLFIPRTQVRNFAWPQDPDVHTRHVKNYVLRLDEDLLSVSAITKGGADLVTLPVSEVFLEPANEGPPYSRLEIDRATTNAAAVFAAGDTSQRAIRVTGSWGYSNATVAAGTVASGLAADATVTSFVCSDASLIDVGDTLLIQSEQVFVSERKNAALGTILLNGALTADAAVVTVTVDPTHGIIAGEVILVDSERMFVESVSTNNLTVKRAYDGSVLAAHADNAAVHIFRTLTIGRGVNGTIAATHADATAISKYAPPAPIVALCRAIAIAEYEQDKGGRTGVIGSGEGATRMARDPLAALWERARSEYMRPLARVI